MRTIKVIAGCAVVLLVSAGVLLWQLGKAFTFEVSHDEVARVMSPSHRVAAVVVESNGGATTSFGYQIYLVAPGKPYREGVEVASLYGAVRNEDAYGANLKWRGPGKLVIEYLDAMNADVIRERTVIQGETVSVALKSGVSDPKAPPGGMLYNLQGRPYDRKTK